MKHSQGKRKKERHETNHSCDHLGSIKHLLDLTSGLLHSGSQLSFEMLTHRLLAESNGNSTLYHIRMIDLCSHRQGYFVLRKRRRLQSSYSSVFRFTSAEMKTTDHSFCDRPRCRTCPLICCQRK